MIKIRVVVSPCEVDGQHVTGDPVVEEPQQQGLTGFSDNENVIIKMSLPPNCEHCKKPYTAAKKSLEITNTFRTLVSMSLRP